MATITGFTAERALEIENAQIIDAAIIGDNLILYTKGGDEFDVGVVASIPGPPGSGVVFLDPGESTTGIPDGTKICRRYV